MKMMTVIVLISTAAFANPYDCKWYNDSWIHTHISINPLVSDMPFFIKQIETVKPDAIQYHTHDTSLMLKSHELNLFEKNKIHPIATINQAGVWYPHYEDSDKYVKRINADGSFAGRWTREHLCFNSPAVDEIIIPNYYRELVRELKPDQVWIDEAMITVNACYCDNCKRLFKEQTGNTAPVVLTDDNFEIWQQWIRFHIDVFETWMEKVVDAVHSVNPDILVTFNASYSLAQPEAPPAFIQNLSHDVHKYPLETGMYARYFSSQDTPFDLMPGLGKDAWAGIEPKTLPHVLTEISMIVTHGGRWNIGEFPTSFTNIIQDEKYTKQGYRPADKYLELAAEGAKFARQRQSFCKDSHSFRNIAILHSASTHYSHVIFNMNSRASGEGFGVTSDGTIEKNLEGINSRIFWSNNQFVAHPIIGAYESLIENHIHFDIIHEQKLQADLEDYSLLILPEQEYLQQATIDKVYRFVKNGGNVLATGSSILPGFEDLFGLNVISNAPQSNVTFAFNGVELTPEKFWNTKLNGAKPIFSFNSTTPAVTENTFGKGKAVYVAGDIFKEYHDRSGISYRPKGDNPAIRTFAKKLYERLIPEPKVKVTAPAWFEFAHRTKDGKQYLHFVNRQLDWKQKTEEFSGNLLVQLPLEKEPLSLKRLPEITDVAYIYTDGLLTFALDPETIEYHCAVEIKN